MIACVGLASGLGAGNKNCGKGPEFLKNHLKLPLNWHSMIIPKRDATNSYDSLADMNHQLSIECKKLVHRYPFFLSFGGDHSSGIGTWSGVAEAKRKDGDIGLLWIDAHMDSHVPETTPSGNIHGMPIAVLLGYGDKRLTHILAPQPKIKPENLALIGIRSFEAEELEFLNRLGVKVYFIEEVKRRGLRVVIEEFLASIAKRTVGYGVSFDIDAVDPSNIFATGTLVPGGIDENEAIEAMQAFAQRPPLAFELVEYNPDLDLDLRTFHFIEKLLGSLLKL